MDSKDLRDHRSTGDAHNDSWAHPVCPAFGVGVGSSGWSTDHVLRHFVNIF